MSVINQMLKELDERKATQGAIAVTPYQAPKAWYQNSGLWVGLALGLGGGGLAFGWLALSKLESPQFIETASMSNKVPVAVIEQAEVRPSSAIDQTASADSKGETAKASTGETDANPVVSQAQVEQAKPKAEAPQIIEENGIAATSVEAEPVTAEPAKPEPSHSSKPQVSKPDSAKPEPSFELVEVVLTKKDKIARAITSAEQWQQQGQFKKAAVDYRTALKLDGSLHQVRKQLAALLFGQNDIKGALSVLQQGRTQYPQEIDFGVLQARILQQSDRMQDAMALLQSLQLIAVPEHAKGLILLSEISQAEQEFVLAESSYRSLSELQPNVAKWWLGLGFALDSQGEQGEALLAYRRALSTSGLSENGRQFLTNRIAQLGG
ncbi:tetratricopeptide repeat protein [Paraferrimonas sedimenticola]|uniref:MSHA biogenesis protein MshN n=1 Tax=Paraferrimonas sedimenticola TaxID=375674 RepID=A0AA37W1F5_9GAMM|nr:tetratricopeptide repeat protein [Paraferrimonas sedimenticola]GLP97390.1 MSHA biogenesis protein MshN [Paraferrimonas sedimenticola]